MIIEDELDSRNSWQVIIDDYCTNDRPGVREAAEREARGGGNSFSGCAYGKALNRTAEFSLMIRNGNNYPKLIELNSSWVTLSVDVRKMIRGVVTATVEVHCRNGR
jgi:hypothetical protein